VDKCDIAAYSVTLCGSSRRDQFLRLVGINDPTKLSAHDAGISHRFWRPAASDADRGIVVSNVTAADDAD
jgi:hypothetical protein